MRRTIAVVSAGLRQPSSTRMLADRLAAAARRELEQLGAEVDVELIELRDHGHDLVDNLLAGYPSEELKRVHETVARADALITVTPTFSASYNGIFKMFVDVLDDTALVDKPVLIAATGGTGRHSLVLEHALRPLFAYLHAVVLPTAVFAAPEDWGAGDTAQDQLVHRIDRAAGELAREVDRREKPTHLDPFDVPTPFEQLLAGE
ncbi:MULTISPECIES: FMN reductase [Micromonospora]|uniref:NADPH-dependent FMN reductase n=1 Tax=Micromonospora sicca TaxID=2202420 RepID=A0A317D2W8_9ACTN|nr:MULTISPECIES: FMN reductase [unclassified Micromonospora]MBM0226359.1 FMN reductase [Micromonospora sp. ATA51]PWR06953.1 NADPH-dependent FMN reductase [Micromonospora sp. 4G51]